MNFKSKKLKALAVMICITALSGAYTLRAEKDISSVNWPIVVNLSHLDFGEVMSGQEAEKTFTVSYSGKGDGEYSIVEKYKPKQDAKVPAGYDGTISDYCQVNHDDNSRCYKNLCPFIEEQSTEDEGDTPEKATVDGEDTTDVWKVILNTPSVGNIKKDSNGGMVSEGGEYGCDLSFNIASIPTQPICGNGVKEKGEACDDGNNKNADGCSAKCQIESCTNNREVCDGKDNNCDGVVDNVFETTKISKTPDQVLLNDGKTNVTSKVASKDDGQVATQKVSGNEYIYMNWNLDAPENSLIGSAKLHIKHKEDGIKVVLEAWNGSKYVQVCDLTENAKSTEEECDLSSVYKGSSTENIKLRMRLYDPTNCSECLDWASLDIDYNKAVPCSQCGNGKVEMDEECDDGNTNDSDSCSNSCMKNRGSISGCKYNDKNANGKVDSGEEKLAGFAVQLVKCPFLAEKDNEMSFLSKTTISNGNEGMVGYCSVVATTTTGNDGCYSFTNLKPGSYGVNEVEKTGWEQTYPEGNEYYYFSLCSGECKQKVNFLNHKVAVPVGGNGTVESGEQCDDGNNKNGDGCSCTCEKESCGNGGSVTPLRIEDEEVNEVTEDSAEFAWTTNKFADSRVVCSKASKSKLGAKPDYGYSFSSMTYDIDPKVSRHNITIYELEPATNYYCRVISSVRNEEVVSSELSFATDEKEEVVPITTSLYIYDLTLEGLFKDKVNLKWNTSKSGTTCVVYAESSRALGGKPKYGYDWITAGCEDLSKQGTNHSITISGLKPCTTYYFRLTSTNGTCDAVTVEQKVRTMCATPCNYYPRPYVPSTSCGGEKGGEKGISDDGSAGSDSSEKGESSESDGTGTNDSANPSQSDGSQAATTCPECEDCPKCEDTVRTVVEKERYMNTEDWIILFLLLMVIFLIANKLINRSRASKEPEDQNYDEED